MTFSPCSICMIHKQSILSFKHSLADCKKTLQKTPPTPLAFQILHYLPQKFSRVFINNPATQTETCQGFETTRIPTYIKTLITQEAFWKQLLKLEELVLTIQNCKDGSGGTGPFLFLHTPGKILFSPRRGEAPYSFPSRNTSSSWRFTTSLDLVPETYD